MIDDHDVQKFMTWSLIADQTNYDGGQSADQQKFEKEFQQYQDQLDKKKEEYHKEHPDAKKEKTRKIGLKKSKFGNFVKFSKDNQNFEALFKH